MKYILTPEFHRNIWLKFSPFRLVAAPVFLAVCTAVCLRIIPDTKGFFETDYSMKLLTNGALYFYVIIVVLWGNYEAGAALQEEMRNNTWDFQRMSSVTALQLVIGKLFGATSYVWYVGLLTLIPFYYGLSHMSPPDVDMFRLIPALSSAPVWTPVNDVYAVLYLLLAGLIGHATSFFVSFVDLTSFVARTGKKRVPRHGGAFVLGMMSSWIAISMAQTVTPKLSDSDSIFRSFRTTTWFGQTYDTSAFGAYTLLFFLFWFAVGCYRIARAELMHRTTPVVWMTFVASFIVYLNGFPNPQGAYYFTGLMAIFVVSLILAYAVMLFEASDVRKYARFWSYLGKGDVVHAFENTHKWVVTIPFVVTCYAMTLQHFPTSGKYLSFEALAAFMTAIMLFAARDGLVIHAFVRGKGARYIGFKAVFYYVMAYMLAPLLHFAFTPKTADGMDVKRWINAFMNQGDMSLGVPEVLRSLALYYPLPVGFAVSVAPVLLEVCAAAVWLSWGIRSDNLRKMQDTQSSGKS